jgi:hypothetical protein
MGTNRRISIDLPAGWTDESIYFFRGPEQAGVQHSLSVLVDDDPGDTSLEDYARDRIAMLHASQPGLEVLKEGTTELDDGSPAYELVYKASAGQDRPEYGRQMFVFRGGTAFTFQGKYAKLTSRTLGTAIDLMIRSFQVEG